MQHVAITGSNRGIGLEVVRQLASRPETEIYAMCRKPDVAAELRALSKDSNGRVHLIAL